MKVKSIKDAAKKKATKTEKVVDIKKAAKKVEVSSQNMKTQNVKDATKKKATKPEKAEDICELAIKTEEDTKKMMLQDIIDIATRMGIDAGDLNRTELVRAIQRAEGYSDCFMTDQVRTCGQLHCLWYQECVLC
ncbi:MAG TPA: hypothetical protein VLG39_07350 [Nitrospirota bacterium]|nr:hypothetical protein [Nitrospirota bacterium]